MTDVIASDNFLKYYNTVPTSSIIGAINSTYNGGAVFGSLMGGFTMDRFGRKKTIQIAAVIAAVGGILQCASVHLAMILVGRIISGWAVGLSSMAIPVYQAECAHPRMRGLVVGLTQQMIGVGFIVSTWIGFGSHHMPDSSKDAQFQWRYVHPIFGHAIETMLIWSRFPLGFQIFPAILLLVGLIWLPESPRWLIDQDRDEEALRVLRKLHYDGHNDDWIHSEYNEIRATISAENAITAPGWRIMFTVPQWRKRLFHGTLVQVFTQMTGISEYPIAVL
jgi:MFS family permease